MLSSAKKQICQTLTLGCCIVADTGDPCIRYLDGWYYVMHSQTHTDGSVLEGASWKDHIIRSRDLEHWQESECSPHPPAPVAGQSRGCPWLDYLQPGDTKLFNLGLPAEAVRVIKETDNRDNSDVDLVQCAH